MNQEFIKFYNKAKDLPFVDDLRFSLFKQGDKNPYNTKDQTPWNQEPSDYIFNLEQLKEKLEKNPAQNWGIMGGRGLIVIDIDIENTVKQQGDQNIKVNDLYLKEFCDDLFPETFTTKTGSGGYHYIYICDNTIPEFYDDLKSNNTRYGELYNRKTRHVVECGSIHPNGNEYKVEKDINFATFSYKNYLSLKNMFLPNAPTKKTTKKQQVKTVINDQSLLQLVKEEVISKIPRLTLNLNQLCTLLGVKSGEFIEVQDSLGEYLEYKGIHPTHGSSNGKNFRVKLGFGKTPNIQMWNCFRHATDNEGETLANRTFFTLYGMLKGVLKCSETSEITPEQIKEISKLILEDPMFKSDKKFIGSLNKDPIHDLLSKYNFYKSLDVSKAVEVDFNNYIFKMFNSALSHVDNWQIVNELIKYSTRYGNEKFSKYTSYYEIINDFISELTPEHYNTYLESFKTENTPSEELLNYNIFVEYFNGRGFKDYALNIEKYINTTQTSFNTFNALDLSENVEQEDYIVEDFISSGSLTLISAEPKAGKTLLTTHLSSCIATGREFFGLQTQKKVVCNFDLENGATIIGNRLKGFVNGYCFTDEEKKDFNDNFKIQIKSNTFGFVSRENQNLKVNTAVLEDCLNFCKTNKVKVIVIDPLVNLGDFDDSNNTHMTYVKNNVLDRFIQNDIAVVLLHHTTKDGSGFRGASAIEGFVNTSYLLNVKSRDNEGNPIKIHLKRMRARSGEIGNLNYEVDIQKQNNLDKKTGMLSSEFKHIKLIKTELNVGLTEEQENLLEALRDCREDITNKIIYELAISNDVITEEQSKMRNLHYKGKPLHWLVRDYLDVDKTKRKHIYKFKSFEFEED